MKQYIITFYSGYTDIVEAYGYKFNNGKATFDLGHKREYILEGVERVDLAESQVTR